MKRIVIVTLWVLVLCLAAACRPTTTPTPLQPTAVVVPTEKPIPPTPTPKVWPTSQTPAPELAVLPVGYTATFQETQHGVIGKAVMAGLQTMIISAFSFDGQGPAAEIRLVKQGNWDVAVAVLLQLEQRPYDKELLVMEVPSHLEPMQADSIAVYCPETKTLYGWGLFQ